MVVLSTDTSMIKIAHQNHTVAARRFSQLTYENYKNHSRVGQQYGQIF